MVPAGVNQDLSITLSTSYQTVCSLTVDLGTGTDAPTAIFVSGFTNYQNTVNTATVYDIAVKIVAGAQTGGVVAQTHSNTTAVIATAQKFTGLTGSTTFSIQVKKNNAAGTYLGRNSGILVQAVRR